MLGFRVRKGRGGCVLVDTAFEVRASHRPGLGKVWRSYSAARPQVGLPVVAKELVAGLLKMVHVLNELLPEAVLALQDGVVLGPAPFDGRRRLVKPSEHAVFQVAQRLRLFFFGLPKIVLRGLAVTGEAPIARIWVIHQVTISQRDERKADAHREQEKRVARPS